VLGLAQCGVPGPAQEMFSFLAGGGAGKSASEERGKKDPDIDLDGPRLFPGRRDDRTSSITESAEEAEDGEEDGNVSLGDDTNEVSCDPARKLQVCLGEIKGDVTMVEFSDSITLSLLLSTSEGDMKGSWSLRLQTAV